MENKTAWPGNYRELRETGSCLNPMPVHAGMGYGVIHDLAKSCPVSYRTINQHGATTPWSESGYHGMRVGRVDSRIRVESGARSGQGKKNCGCKDIRFKMALNDFSQKSQKRPVSREKGRANFSGR